MANSQEKRGAERFDVRPDVSCTFASPVLEDFGPVKIKNVSTSGVGLLLSEPVETDMLLVVTLANTAKKFTKNALVRVVHVTFTPQSGGDYLVGGTFDTPLTYEELTKLVM
jgi:hypothetical protein